MLRVVWCMNFVIFTIHPEREVFSLTVTMCLKDRNNAYPVTLRENALIREADRVRLNQLLRGIVDSIVWETGYWQHLRSR